MSGRIGSTAKSIVGMCVLALGCTVAFSGPADAGLPSEKLKARIAKAADGPYGVNVRLNINPGQVKNAYMKVKSVTGDPEPAKLTQSLFPIGMTIKYFTKRGEDITSQVANDPGYPFTAKPNKTKQFRIRVKLNVDAGNCFFPQAADDSAGFALVRVAVNQPVAGCI